MWVLLSTLAVAAPVEPEEVVVYDRRAMWDGTRFLIDSEQALSTGVDLGTPAHGTFTSPAWQFQMVFACELEGRRRAVCTIEDAAIRASTVDLWQRPSDLERVETILAGLHGALVGTEIEVHFDRAGGLTRSDLRQAASNVYVNNVVDLATRMLGGVTLPDGALVDGAVWDRRTDPLLRLPATIASYQNGVINHFGNHLDGWYIVQSMGEAAMNVVLLPPEDRTAGLPSQVQNLEEFSLFHERGEEAYGVIRMKSVSAYDPETGIVAERVFSVHTGMPRPFWQAGAVRRLAPRETPVLGATTQVAYPHSPRLNVPTWEPIARIGLPFIEEPVLEW